MPRASIPHFDTDKPENYLDYKNMMEKILIFPTEDLNISTLMASIKGSRRQQVLNWIKHKTDMASIWEVLDSKFGNIDVTQQALRRKLETMEVHPRTEEGEQANKDCILDFIDLSKRHDRVSEFIHTSFIWDCANNLRWSHRNYILEKIVFNPEQFEKYLRKISLSNDLSIRTRFPDKRKSGLTGNHPRTRDGVHHRVVVAEIVRVEVGSVGIKQGRMVSPGQARAT